MQSTRPLKTRAAVVILMAIALLITSIAPGTGELSDAAANDDRSVEIRKPDTSRRGDTGPVTALNVFTDAFADHVWIHDESASTNAGSETLAVGPPSCALACIERAWLSGALSTTDLTLDVETNADAAITYAVGSHAPFLGKDGVPYFSTNVTTGHTFIDVTEWETTVKTLAADTDYHIIVTATDEAGTHAVTGTFRTVTPAATGLDSLGHAGEACAVSCIESVVLAPRAGGDALDVEVTTNHSAHIFVYFGTELESWVDGKPHFDDVITQVGGPTTNNDWEATANGFTPEQTYRVAVLAIDDHGGIDIHLEWVTMQDYPRFDLLYVPLRLKVTENGDDIGKGELRFIWRVGDPYNPLHTGSRKPHKMEDGESFYFHKSSQYHVFNVGENEVLPDFTITGFEKDNDLIAEFPSAHGGPYVDPQAGYIAASDEAYNTAQMRQWAWNGFFEAPTVGDIDDLPNCESFDEINSDHPFADAACIKISTHPAGGPGGEEYPEFWTILAITAQPATDPALP